MTSSIKAPEFWVTRVLLHEGKTVQLALLPPGVAASVTAEVEAGGLALLSDGSICEPVEVFDNEWNAHKHRETLAAQFPKEDFRVVMTAQVTV